MIKIDELFDEELLESGAPGTRIRHIFENGDLTFADIRDILQKVFSGDMTLEEKIDGINLLVTYRDGRFCAARNQKTLKEPMDYDRLTAKYCGSPKEVQDAFMNSLKDLSVALSELDPVELNRYFANGRNFLNCEIVYPPCQNVMDYGNKCFIVLHGIKCYNDKYREVGEDKASAEELFAKLKENGALAQEMFEITKPNILRIKDSVLAKDAVAKAMARLEKFIDGVGWKCTLDQYVQDRYSRHIVNKALEHGIDVSRNSDFVRSLSQRLSQVSGRKPTKSDLVTYAKCDGVDYRSDAYREFLDDLETNCEATNAEIIRPIEDLIIWAGVTLMKNVVGFMSLDPSRTAKHLRASLDDAVLKIREGEFELSPEKIARFKKNMAKVQQYVADLAPAEGIVFKWRGRVLKICGAFGGVNQIIGLIKYA